MKENWDKLKHDIGIFTKGEGGEDHPLKCVPYFMNSPLVNPIFLAYYNNIPLYNPLPALAEFQNVAVTPLCNSAK